MNNDEYNPKYRQKVNNQQSRSQSLGTVDLMGGSYINNFVSSDYTNGGMLVTTTSNDSPSQTYTLTSALSMK